MMVTDADIWEKYNLQYDLPCSQAQLEELLTSLKSRRGCSNQNFVQNLFKIIEATTAKGRSSAPWPSMLRGRFLSSTSLGFWFKSYFFPDPLDF